MVEYFELLKKSWFGFKDNLVLFVPYIVELLLGLCMVLLAGIQILIIFSLESVTLTSFFQDTSSFGELQASTIFIIVVMAIIDFILVIMIQSYIGSMYIGMGRDIITKGKTNMNNMFKHGKDYFLTVLEVNILMLIIAFLPTVVLIILDILLVMANQILGIIAVIFSVLLIIAYFIFLGVALFFLDPAIAYYKYNALSLIKFTMNYAKRNLGHTVLTLLLSIAIMILFSIIFSILQAPLNLLIPLGKGSAAIFAIVIILFVLFYLIRTIIGFILGMIVYLFKFHAFKAEK